MWSSQWLERRHLIIFSNAFDFDFQCGQHISHKGVFKTISGICDGTFNEKFDKAFNPLSANPTLKRNNIIKCFLVLTIGLLEKNLSSCFQ